MTVERLEAVSWSELKTFQRCPKQWEFKYKDRLVPKAKSRPLFLGSWVHAGLESHYKLGDWKIGHQEYLNQYEQLFDEEREVLDKKHGPLPEQVERITKSYLWYYRDDGWKVVATEQRFTVDTPLKLDGKIQTFDGIIDLIVEDPEGRWWVVDHKTASTIPDANSFHAMDPQLMLYPWAAKKAWGYDIAGIIYNYIKSKAPSIPKLNKDGTLSARKLVTDYPTLYRFLKQTGYDPNEFSDVLRPLQRKSPFLRRYRLPREDRVTKEILLDALSTAKRIRTSNRFPRTITRDCARMCSYHDLCRADLNGFDTTLMRQTQFTPKEAKVVDSAESQFEEPEEWDDEAE